jgi:hypothetical protein
VRREEYRWFSWIKISIFIVAPLFLVPFVIAEGPGQDKIFQPAGTYLVEQFGKKDVILAGESHRIREHAEFIARMIPLLHQSGINLLFSEFASSGDSALIDSLLTGKVYDESLARLVMWKNTWYWAYKEYGDVYYSAWKVNQHLQRDEQPFRIIGLESTDYGMMDPELAWAKLVKRIALDQNKKALIWCGLHHSFTNYHQPYFVKDSLQGFVTTRLGNLLYRKFPERVMTVVLHAPMKAAPKSGNDYVLPCDGKIDSMVERLPIPEREIGFNTDGILPGHFSMKNTFYGTCYPELLLKDFCQGYVVVKPVCDLHMVTIIPGFIDSSNVMETRKMAEMGDLTPQSFGDTIQTWLETESRFLLDVQKQVCFSPRR